MDIMDCEINFDGVRILNGPQLNHTKQGTFKMFKFETYC